MMMEMFVKRAKDKTKHESACLLTGLHAYERAPDEDSRTVEQAGRDVAEQQDGICPMAADIRGKVSVEATHCRRIRLLARPAEQWGFFVLGPKSGRQARDRCRHDWDRVDVRERG
jgi:hypothetical protein